MTAVDWAAVRQGVIDRFGLTVGVDYTVIFERGGRHIRLRNVTFRGDDGYVLTFVQHTRGERERWLSFEGPEIVDATPA